MSRWKEQSGRRLVHSAVPVCFESGKLILTGGSYRQELLSAADLLDAEIFDLASVPWLKAYIDLIATKADVGHGHEIANVNGLQEALNAVEQFGSGQTWQELTASRFVNVTYTNSTGRTIAVAIDSSGNSSTGGILLVDGVQVFWGTATPQATPFFTIVPPGSTYRFNHTSFSKWLELR